MEQLKHECGVAMIRLLKPLDYYETQYGTWAYGFNKLYLMMEKQHNRGQEGAGIASVSLTGEPGTEYMFREKAEGKDAITEIFSRVTQEMAGELLMGHLRYSTTGKSGLTFVHPFLRRNNWRAKNLCLCGNFNMTNIDEVFQFLTSQVVRRNGDFKLEQTLGEGTAVANSSLFTLHSSFKYSACSFERIYFSRGSDRDIYQERKRLGEQLTPAILKAIDGDVENTVFSYIPNTAEVTFYGMVDGVRKSLPYGGRLEGAVRTEKVVWKDIKLRTFISANTERNDLAAPASSTRPSSVGTKTTTTHIPPSLNMFKKIGASASLLQNISYLCAIIHQIRQHYERKRQTD